MEILSKRFIYLLLAVSAGVVSTVANAQLNNSPALRTFASGGSDLQRSTGVFIADVCDALGALGSRNGAQADLFTACGTIADEAAGDGPLNLTDDALYALIEAVAPEEVTAIASNFTDTAQGQLANVANRLEFLRNGVATGVADIQWNNGMTGGAAGADFSKFGFYVNGNYGFGDKDKTEQENGFDYDAYNLTFGADYRFSDQWVGGVALSFLNSEMDFDGDSGSTDSDGFDLTFYGSYYMDQFYFDGVLGFGKHDYDGTRKIGVSGFGSHNIDSSTDADSIHLSAGGGYMMSVKEWNHNLFARLDYVDVDIDGYTEKGSFLAMEVGDQEVESMQIILGGQTSITKSVKWGVIAPYAGLEWRFELEDDTRVVTAGYALDELGSTFSFSSDDADSNYGVLSLGSNFVLAQGMQIFVNYDYVVGLSDVTANTLAAGVRFEF